MKYPIKNESNFNLNDGFDGFIDKIISDEKKFSSFNNDSTPHFTETNSTNYLTTHTSSQSLFSNSVQNQLFSSLSNSKKSLVDLSENTENFAIEAKEINKRLDNLTKILEKMILSEKQMNPINDKLESKNNKNEVKAIEKLEDFDSRLEKLKQSIEQETKEDHTETNAFRLREIDGFPDDYYANLGNSDDEIEESQSFGFS